MRGDQLRKVVSGLLEAGVSRDEIIRATRQAITMWAVNQANGNQCHAAKMIGVHRNTVSRVINETRVA